MNPAQTRRNTQAAMIIFPTYADGIPFRVRRLTCANAGLLLIKSLINARNLTSDGFHETAMFSRKVPAYRITYGDSAQVVQAVNSWLAC